MAMRFESTDRDLLRRFKSTEGKVWDEFLETYRPFIESVLRKRGTPEDKVDDRVQDVMLKLIAAMPTFECDAGGHFRSWLATVIRNVMIDYGRRAARRPAVIGGTDFQRRVAEVPDEGLSAEEAELLCDVLDREMMERLLAPIRERSPGDWAIWRRLQGPPERGAAEVAKELGKAVTAVYQARYRVTRALEKLAKDVREKGRPGSPPA